MNEITEKIELPRYPNWALANRENYAIKWKKELRDILIDAYLDYRNDYLTINKFAEHHGLYPNEAQALINLGKGAWQHKHPEA